MLDNSIEFGDKIRWDKHVIEIITKEKKIFYNNHTKRYEEILNIIKKYKLPPAKVLDCGCHIGRWIEVFKEAGYNYTGIDQSQYAINIAKQFHPNDKFICNFLWDMNFNEEFEIVFMNAVLQHNTLVEKCRIIPKIYNALKYNGIYYFAESTVEKETDTQLTHEQWIDLMELNNFKFLESWHKNELNLNDNYLFIKNMNI